MVRMKKNIKKLSLLLVLVVFFSVVLSFNSPVYARSSETATIVTLYDDASNTWKTVVIMSSEEIERNYITNFLYSGGLEFVQSSEDYRSFNVVTVIYDGDGGDTYVPSEAKTIQVTFADGTGSSSIPDGSIVLSYHTSSGTPIEIGNGKGYDYMSQEIYPAGMKALSAPMTFPSNTAGANESDINRAYIISTKLNTSLNEALLFLNDGVSFDTTNRGQRDFFQLTHLLLSASDGQTICNTRTGGVFQINWNYYEPGVPCTGNQPGYYCHIEKVSQYPMKESGEECDKTQNAVELTGSDRVSSDFLYRMRKGYYYSEYNTTMEAQRQAYKEYALLTDSSHNYRVVQSSNYKKIEPTGAFVPKYTVDQSSEFAINTNANYLYYWGLKNIEFKASAYADIRFDEPGDDNTLNTLKKNENYLADAEYINWFQMVIEAQMYKAQGFTYANQNDLLISDSEDYMFVKVVRNLLRGLENLLGCYSLEQLVYNDGVRGSYAYYGGVFPMAWMENIQIFFIVCCVIAFSILSIAFAKNVVQRNLATIMPSLRASIMESLMNIIVVVFIVGFLFLFLRIIFDGNAAFVNVFAELSKTDRYRSLEFSSNGTGTLAGIIIQFAYFFILIWLNIIYLIRSIILALLVATSPLFIAASAFGKKGREITKAFMSEFFGNLLIQPVHAVVITFLMSVNMGLRGIEAIVFTACLIPITNMVKAMVGRGGGLASKLASTLTANGAGMAGSIANGAVQSVGSLGSRMSDAASRTVVNSSRGSISGHGPVGGVAKSISQSMANDGKIYGLNRFGIGKAISAGSSMTGAVTGAAQTLAGIGLATSMAGADNGAMVVAGGMINSGMHNLSSAAGGIGTAIGNFGNEGPIMGANAGGLNNTGISHTLDMAKTPPSSAAQINALSNNRNPHIDRNTLNTSSVTHTTPAGNLHVTSNAAGRTTARSGFGNINSVRLLDNSNSMQCSISTPKSFDMKSYYNDMQSNPEVMSREKFTSKYFDKSAFMNNSNDLKKENEAFAALAYSHMLTRTGQVDSNVMDKIHEKLGVSDTFIDKSNGLSLGFNCSNDIGFTSVHTDKGKLVGKV